MPRYFRLSPHRVALPLIAFLEHQDVDGTVNFEAPQDIFGSIGRCIVHADDLRFMTQRANTPQRAFDGWSFIVNGNKN